MKKKWLIVISISLILIPLITFSSTVLIITFQYDLGLNKASIDSLDENGIPVRDYYINGEYTDPQYTPVLVSQGALSYWEQYRNGNTSSLDYFMNCANWLRDNYILRGNMSIWLYNFPWPIYNFPSGWISGMGQAEAAEVLLYAYIYSKETIYNNISQYALNSLLYNVSEGGVTIIENEISYWYELYASRSVNIETRVLNGHLKTLISLDKYYIFSNYSLALNLFQKGVTSLKANIQDYDIGGWTYYDKTGILSSSYYHQINIDFLDELYELTNDDFYYETSLRWKSYQNSILQYYYRWKENIYVKIFFPIIIISILIVPLIWVIRFYKKNRRITSEKIL